MLRHPHAQTSIEIQTAGPARQATDEEILQIISKEIKQRKDSIEQYERQSSRAAKEKAEMAFLKNTPLKWAKMKSKPSSRRHRRHGALQSRHGQVMGAIMPSKRQSRRLANRLVKCCLAADAKPQPYVFLASHPSTKKILPPPPAKPLHSKKPMAQQRTSARIKSPTPKPDIPKSDRQAQKFHK